jgi:membrane protein YdbS with pleckstrin-like domain
MYCNQCGEVLPPSSRFCNVCGSAVASGRKSEAERGPASKSDYAEMDAAARRAPAPQKRDVSRGASDMSRFAPNEEVIFTLRPTLVFVFLRYAVAALVVVATAAAMGLLSSMVSGMVALLITTIVALVAFAIPVYKHILRRREVYTLTNHKLEMRYGLLAKIVRNIPLRNIQDVTVTASAWQRLINIGDIEIDSASEGGKIVLDDIHYPERYANIILGELRRRN